MFSLFFHDHPKLFVQYESFWFLLFDDSTSFEHHDNTFILYFSSSLIDFEFNSLIDYWKLIVREFRIFYHLAFDFLYISAHIQIYNGHFKEINFVYSSTILSFLINDELNCFIDWLDFAIFDEKDFIVWVFSVNTYEKLVFIFVGVVMNLFFFGILFCIKWWDLFTLEKEIFLLIFIKLCRKL